MPVAQARLAGHTVSARTDLNKTIATIDALPPGSRACAATGDRSPWPRSCITYGRDRLGDTSNISVVDHDGNACVITLTLGIGSGVWIPGHGVHLNSMLGEGELMTPDLAPGRRMSSNMCPLVVVDNKGDLVLAAGSAGASRIRTALIDDPGRGADRREVHHGRDRRAAVPPGRG